MDSQKENHSLTYQQKHNPIQGKGCFNKKQSAKCFDMPTKPFLKIVRF